MRIAMSCSWSRIEQGGRQGSEPGGKSKNAIKFVYKMPLNDSWHIFTNGNDKMTAPHG